MRKVSLALGVLLILAAGDTAVGGSQASRGQDGVSPPPSIATVEITPSRLDWSLVLGVGNDPITLTIAGPQGFYFEKRFPRGIPPAFELGEIRNRPLPDGTYSYELRTMGKGSTRVQSGFLSLRDGRIFVPATIAHGTALPPASRKPTGPPLQLKDSQGDTCIGDGCAGAGDGNPLRLESSFLRLDFTDDTDGFSEDHDWAIEANAAVGGGAYLAFEDVDNLTRPFKVIAGAPDNALLVSSSGKVGIGTATPAVQLDAKVTSSGNHVARLQNLSSSGYSGIEYLDNSGSVDMTLGVDNANSATRLNSLNSNPISILTNSTERMRITSSGSVGIGTTSPSDKVHIVDGTTGAVPVRVQNTSASGFSGIEYDDEGGTTCLFIGLDNANNNTRFNSINSFPIVFLLNGTERLRFPSSGNVITAANGAFLSSGGTWTNASSRALKQDIHELDADSALATVKGLNPVEFAYKADPNEHHVGFIAEDVPPLVAENDRKGLSPMDVVAVLTKVVQEQQKTIETLNARLDALERKP